MKKSKSQVILVETDMFPNGLVFFMAEEDETLYEELIRGIVKLKNSDLVEYKNAYRKEKDNAGFAFIDDENGTWQVIVFTEKKHYQKTLVHELLHAVEKICAYRDIPISKDTEEVRAMLIGHIFGKVQEVIKV